MRSETIDIANKHERYQFTAYVGHVFSEMGLLGEYENAINKAEFYANKKVTERVR